MSINNWRNSWNVTSGQYRSGWQQSLSMKTDYKDGRQILTKPKIRFADDLPQQWRIFYQKVKYLQINLLLSHYICHNVKSSELTNSVCFLFY